MSLYLDTSALAALFVPERESGAVSDLVRAQGGDVTLSAWTLVEAASALAIKVRVGVLTAEAAAGVQGRIRIAAAGLVRSVEQEDFDAAALLISGSAAPLRAGDALHLAICKRLGSTLLTLDKEMQTAAQGFGFAVA